MIFIQLDTWEDTYEFHTCCEIPVATTGLWYIYDKNARGSVVRKDTNCKTRPSLLDRDIQKIFPRVKRPSRILQSMLIRHCAGNRLGDHEKVNWRYQTRDLSKYRRYRTVDGKRILSDMLDPALCFPVGFG